MLEADGQCLIEAAYTFGNAYSNPGPGGRRWRTSPSKRRRRRPRGSFMQKRTITRRPNRRLADGRILIIATHWASEIYDPVSGAFTTTGARRSRGTTSPRAVQWPSVLVVGGDYGNASMATAEISTRRMGCSPQLEA